MSLPTLGKYCIEKSKCTPWPLYIRLRGFIGVPFRERERREISSRSIVSTTTTYRRRYGTPCLVSRLEIVPRGQKTHGSTTVREEDGEEGGGKREKGELEAYRRERAGWIGKKEERERERETGIIVGKDGGWMLSFGDACIIVYVTWLERIVQRDTEPSGVRLQQRVRRRITTRAIKNFNTTIIIYFCQKEDWSTVISTKLHPASHFLFPRE